MSPSKISHLRVVHAGGRALLVAGLILSAGASSTMTHRLSDASPSSVSRDTPSGVLFAEIHKWPHVSDQGMGAKRGVVQLAEIHYWFNLAVQQS